MQVLEGEISVEAVWCSENVTNECLLLNNSVFNVVVFFKIGGEFCVSHRTLMWFNVLLDLLEGF